MQTSAQQPKKHGSTIWHSLYNQHIRRMACAIKIATKWLLVTGLMLTGSSQWFKLWSQEKNLQQNGHRIGTTLNPNMHHNDIQSKISWLVSPGGASRVNKLTTIWFPDNKSNSLDGPTGKSLQESWICSQSLQKFVWVSLENPRLPEFSWTSH